MMAAFCLLIFSMMLRIGEINSSTLSVVLQKFIIYAFGDVQSFDTWISTYYKPSDGMSLGAQTFLGISNLIGVAVKTQGVYSSLPGTASNVYTAFRGVVSDFGIIGGIVFTSILGFFIGASIKTIRDSIMPRFSIFFVVQGIFFFIFGMFVSPWTYLSYILAVFVFYFYLLIGLRRKILAC